MVSTSFFVFCLAISELRVDFLRDHHCLVGGFIPCSRYVQVPSILVTIAMQKALLFIEKDGKVVCELCSHNCHIGDGRRGLCGVRENKKGILYSHVYGELVAQHVDPVEKKPLFHVLPGTTSYSISTVGCNFRCQHCQNSTISQATAMSVAKMSGNKCGPEFVVAEALRNGCSSISYTYVEPTVFFEFAYDCCKLATTKAIKNIFVSNGYLSEKASRTLAPYLDAINIDIKAFRDSFYKKVCGAHLRPVLDTVTLMKELGVWVEVTTLVIPGLNDSKEELEDIASFLAELDQGIPWHVTAFHPMHQMLDRPSTPLSTLEMARRIGLRAGLKYVYEGNMPGAGGENTYCPSCQAQVIQRYGFSIQKNDVKEGKCHKCGENIEGVWK